MRIRYCLPRCKPNTEGLNLWEGITLAEIVAERALRHPQRAAIVGPEPLTYGELWQRARRLAGYLVDAGMQPGEFLLCGAIELLAGRGAFNRGFDRRASR